METHSKQKGVLKKRRTFGVHINQQLFAYVPSRPM